MRRMLRVLLSCLLFISYSTSGVRAAVFYVNGSMSNNNGGGGSWGTAMKDIQAAINATAAGDTIWVKAGTYLPTLNPSGGTANGSIGTTQRDNTFYLTTKDVKIYGGFSGNETLLSQRNALTNITTLSGDDDSYHVVVTNSRTNACVIDGFTIEGGWANGPSAFLGYYQNSGSGMFNLNSSPTVSNCTFTSNEADYGGGMYNVSGNPTVNNCVFVSNTAAYNGGECITILMPAQRSVTAFSHPTRHCIMGGYV